MKGERNIEFRMWNREFRREGRVTCPPLEEEYRALRPLPGLLSLWVGTVGGMKESGIRLWREAGVRMFLRVQSEECRVQSAEGREY